MGVNREWCRKNKILTIKLLGAFFFFEAFHVMTMYDSSSWHLLLYNIEDPVADIKREESDRKDDPRVLVDDVNVLDLRHRGPYHGSAAFESVQHFRAVTVARRPMTKARPHRRAISARYPKARWELCEVKVVGASAGVVAIPQRSDRRHSNVLELNNVLVSRWWMAVLIGST